MRFPRANVSTKYIRKEKTEYRVFNDTFKNEFCKNNRWIVRKDNLNLTKIKQERNDDTRELRYFEDSIKISILEDRQTLFYNILSRFSPRSINVISIIYHISFFFIAANLKNQLIGANFFQPLFKVSFADQQQKGYDTNLKRSRDTF